MKSFFLTLLKDKNGQISSLRLCSLLINTACFVIFIVQALYMSQCLINKTELDFSGITQHTLALSAVIGVVNGAKAFQKQIENNDNNHQQKDIKL